MLRAAGLLLVPLLPFLVPAFREWLREKAEARKKRLEAERELK